MNANQGSIPLTKQGYEKLLQKVKRMKEVDRPAVIKAIEEARAHGDLSENAEYHAAKEKQGQIEAEIRTLESKLSRAQVIDTSRLSGERVVFGAHVKFLDVEKDEEFTYQIVGDEG
ncbi:MAG: transcription elongation factor GreA, partial [Deltaproteobacteria bacterium]|nr:transcription elongation factor GreA [Deltaproteobacteria bacterium]